MIDHNKKDWIQTYKNEAFSFTDLDSNSIDIEEIAHALSQLCRFTGHCREFYSVAQHCLHVSELVPSEHALEGLMHDAAEAYVGDISRPLKNLIGPRYREISNEIEARIAQNFALKHPWDVSIHRADVVALMTERRDFFLPIQWPDAFEKIEPDAKRLKTADPKDVEVEFLMRFDTLRRERY